MPKLLSPYRSIVGVVVLLLTPSSSPAQVWKVATMNTEQIRALDRSLFTPGSGKPPRLTDFAAKTPANIGIDRDALAREAAVERRQQEWLAKHPLPAGIN